MVTNYVPCMLPSNGMNNLVGKVRDKTVPSILFYLNEKNITHSE